MHGRLEPKFTTAESVTCSPRVCASHRGVRYADRGRHDGNLIEADTGYK